MPISIVPVGGAEDDLWRLLREVSTILRGLPWTLVGGLMVRVIEAEHGAITTWTTGDIDTVLDVRALSNATEPSGDEVRWIRAKNWLQPPDDQTFVSAEGLHEAAGVRWIERMQLFDVMHR